MRGYDNLLNKLSSCIGTGSLEIGIICAKYSKIPITEEAILGGCVAMKSSGNLSELELKRIHKIKSELQLIQKNDFKDEVCGVFDLMIETGIDHNEAIRKTRSALRAINYPHATYDVVIANLRASGRLRKNFHEKMREGKLESSAGRAPSP